MQIFSLPRRERLVNKIKKESYTKNEIMFKNRPLNTYNVIMWISLCMRPKIDPQTKIGVPRLVQSSTKRYKGKRLKNLLLKKNNATCSCVYYVSILTSTYFHTKVTVTFFNTFWNYK